MMIMMVVVIMMTTTVIVMIQPRNDIPLSAAGPRCTSQPDASIPPTSS